MIHLCSFIGNDYIGEEKSNDIIFRGKIVFQTDDYEIVKYSLVWFMRHPFSCCQV